MNICQLRRVLVLLLPELYCCRPYSAPTNNIFVVKLQWLIKCATSKVINPFIPHVWINSINHAMERMFSYKFTAGELPSSLVFKDKYSITLSAIHSPYKLWQEQGRRGRRKWVFEEVYHIVGINFILSLGCHKLMIPIPLYILASLKPPQFHPFAICEYRVHNNKCLKQ